MEHVISKKTTYTHKEIPPSPNRKENILPLMEDSFSSRNNNGRLVKTDGSPDLWLPFYLKRTTLCLFLLLFGTMIVALEAMYIISQRQKGLGDAVSNLRYLWTYGPTSIFTIVAAFWGRVEYEAKVTAPWLRPNSMKDTLLLDYISPFWLAVLFSALRNRDYHVAVGTTVSLLLTLLIVISTGLFLSIPVEVVDYLEPIAFTGRFLDDPSRLEDVSALPFMSMMGSSTSPLSEGLGIGSINLPYPNGCSDEYAYQPFVPDRSDLSELRVSTDGLSLTFECEHANVHSLDLGSIFLDGAVSAGQYFTMVRNASLTVELGGCRIGKMLEYAHISEMIEDNTFSPTRLIQMIPTDGFGRDICNSTSLDDKRVVFFSAEVQYTATNTSAFINQMNGTLYTTYTTKLNSTALVCAPKYDQKLIEVVQDAKGERTISINRTASSNTLVNVHPWSIMKACLDSYLRTGSLFLGIQDSHGIIQGDPHSIAAIKDCGDTCLKESILNDTMLQVALNKYYRKYAAFLIHQTLMDQVNTTSTGVSRKIETRLMVQEMACQWIVAILATSMIIITMLLFTPKKTLSHRLNPGSIFSYAALAGQQTSLSFPRNLGAIDAKTMKKELGMYERVSLPHAGRGTVANSIRINQTAPDQAVAQEKDNGAGLSSMSSKATHPLILQPISIILVHIFIVGFLVALEIILRTSDADNGLGVAPDNTYWHYAWTSAPAMLLALLAMWLGSIDSQHRLLAPYTILAHSLQPATILYMDWLRPMRLVVLLQQFRSRNFSAMGMTAAALLSSMYAIPSASLFRVSSITVYSTSYLRLTDIFTPNVASGPSVSIISSLVLERNLSYTNQFYEDLVFPSLVLEGPSGTQNVSSDISVLINSTVPALHPGLSCQIIEQSSITSSFIFREGEMMGSNVENVTEIVSGVMVSITDQTCTKQKMFSPINNNESFLNSFENGGFFGAAPGTGARKDGCSSYLYIWGGFSSTHDPSSITASAMICNATLTLVDVDLYLKGPNLNIDTSRPPEVIESSARSVSFPSLRETDLLAAYGNLASLPPPNNTIFDNCFDHLTTSRYAIPLSFIGDPIHSQAVADAVSFQHGILLAVSLSQYSRFDIHSPTAMDQSQVKLPLTLSYNTTTGDPDVFPATTTDFQGRRRILQDPISTRILQSLLLSTLVMSLSGTLLSHRKAVLPQSPTSAASVLALLAGGDALKHIYAHRDWKSEKYQYRLGWGPRGTLNGEGQLFGIWVVRKGTDKRTSSRPPSDSSALD